MCSDCALFFDTPNSPNNGLCPICRKPDVVNEKVSLERVRNDLWIKAYVEKVKSRNRAITLLLFFLAVTAIWLVLELVAEVNLLELIGINAEPYVLPVVKATVSLNAFVALVPAVVGVIVFLCILHGASKKSYRINLQGNAYEQSRDELHRSIESIDSAVVKNRSNNHRL
jgi:hypothetical protein